MGVRYDARVSVATEIWNRACGVGGPNPAPRAGDIALAAMIGAHSLIMNGGVEHALGVLSAGEVAAACLAYRRYGFEETARLLEEGHSGPVDEERSLALDHAYYASGADDAALSAAFERDLQTAPDDYSLARPS